MISPSEGTAVDSFGTRAVLPLEFEAIEEHVSASSPDVEVMRVVETQPATAESIAAMEQQLVAHAAEIEQRLEVLRGETWEEARKTLGREYEERIVLERGAMIKLSEQFARERTKYFAVVEGEVVRLALSIAERILSREARLDPLLLRGVVKAALQKIQDESAVTLHVPAHQVEEWEAVLRDEPLALTVIGNPKLEVGECVLETNAGTAELGMKAQLKEIEFGFFDLLERRPA